MSGILVDMVLDRFPFGRAETFLAVVLAKYASDDGKDIWPSMATLAKKIRSSERTTQLMMRKFEKSGWIIDDGHSKGGRGWCRKWKINKDWIAGIDIFSKGAEISPFSEKGEIECVKGAIATAPESLLEPSSLKPYAHSAREAHDSAADPDSPDLEIFPEIQNRQLVQSWMVICRTKKVPVNKAACDRIRNEAKISGIPLEEALTICRDKNWAGFKNSWLANLRKPATTTPLPGETLAASHQPARIDLSTPSQEQWQRNKAKLAELQKFKRVFAVA